MLYSRLAKIKALSKELYENPPKTDTVNPVAVELGLRPENVEVKFNTEDRYSDIMVNLYELIDGNMETVEFEERAREMFSTFGYISFTIKEIAVKIGKEVNICDEVNF
jgi:histone deacetylase complex regulatory component SIN3